MHLKSLHITKCKLTRYIACCNSVGHIAQWYVCGWAHHAVYLSGPPIAQFTLNIISNVIHSGTLRNVPWLGTLCNIPELATSC
jgi:hypothetical protein